MGKFDQRVWKWFFLTLFLSLCSCSTQSMEEFREEGRKETRALTRELEAISNRKELEEALPRLRSRFLSIVDIMTRARSFYLSHPEQELVPLSSIDDELNRRLKAELERIYQIPDGRKYIERSQEAALRRLDTFEKKIYQSHKN